MEAAVRKLLLLVPGWATRVQPQHDIEEGLGAPPAAASPESSGARTLTELLVPATFCTAIFASITPAIQEKLEEYTLYLPLLAAILLGNFISFIAIFYTLRRTRDPAPAPTVSSAAAATAEADRVALIKETLLKLGLIYGMTAFILRILLQLNRASFLPLSIYILAGAMAGAASVFILVAPP